MSFLARIPKSRTELETKFQSAASRLARIREKGEEMSGNVIAGAEVVGGAFAAGYLNGAKGTSGQPYELMGYDADLVAGVGGFALGVSGALGKNSHHALMLGLGFLSSWAAREGQAKGVASLTTGTTTTSTT